MAVAFQRPLGNAARTLRTVATFPPTRRVPPVRPVVAKAIAAVIGAAVLFLGRMELKVPGEFKVFPARNAEVHAMVDGLVEQVLVEEGDRVRAGDVLARLSDRDYRAELPRHVQLPDCEQFTVEILSAHLERAGFCVTLEPQAITTFGGLGLFFAERQPASLHTKATV
jgi:multidrug efflux pump subunit AcrA (membrane-fusion protein)